MAAPGIGLTIVMKLVRAMQKRASADGLGKEHPLCVRANELDDAYERRFLKSIPDCSSPYFVDCYVRAFAAWHAHTGSDEVPK